jgi:carboxyl-terminal processing protease
LQITSFTALTPEEFDQAVANLYAANVRGIILDLRNNPGGLLQESIHIADQFLNEGTILIEESRTAGRVSSEATLGGNIIELPVVVLVNRGTASAAEVVAVAIQENERGIVIGQRTLGKGSVQFIFRLDDGSSIHITSSIWLTPNGSPLEGIGLIPTIEMIPDENGRDVEFGEALRQLRTLITAEN